MANIDDVRTLTKAAKRNGGGTISVSENVGRYVVGGLRTVTATMRDAMRQIGDIASRLGDVADADTLGSWLHDGIVYYDYGSRSDNLSEAISLARERGELAIFDTVANVDIPTL